MKLSNYLFAGIVIFLTCAGLYFLVPAATEQRQSTRTLFELEQNLIQQEEEMERLKREITALRTDYRAIERVAREKFGWCREGEKIYHFDTVPAEVR